MATRPAVAYAPLPLSSSTLKSYTRSTALVQHKACLPFGPNGSEAEGEVGDHGTDESAPVEAQLSSRGHGHASLHSDSHQP